ncbi:DUF2242 domain-containing protein [Trinickia diaoshuihuensis]|uniref:DUF2242 domain-containing protein n=1 Tax=Trinickia diaoshuihuensis TaxID=2292265 RepID=UPI000E2897FA|nr:DUF2242 domain-containing protein [Trinickia diaoshuihuensis]
MSSSFRLFRVRAARTLAALTAMAALAACSSAPQPKFQQEMFDTGASPFSRTFKVGNADACEAVRRALLNQGYLTTLTQTDRIDATKDFQPSGDSHVTVEFHVVCTPGIDADGSSIVYANAIQSGYTLKKSDTSASVGLSLLGSVSLPIRSNSDAMVKVSSETIQSNAFYDRFFDSVQHYVSTLIKTAPVPTAAVTATTLPGAPRLIETPAASAATTVVAPAASLLSPAVPAAAPAVSASAPLPVALGPADPVKNANPVPSNPQTPAAQPAPASEPALAVPQ